MTDAEFNHIKGQLDRIEQLALLRAKEVLSLDECALITGYTKSHLYRLTSQRRIPFYKPMGGMIYFKKSEVEAWLLQNRQATDDEINAQAETYCKVKTIQ